MQTALRGSRRSSPLQRYNILGVAVPDQDFRAMRSDAKDVGIGRAVPLAQFKSLMPLVRTAHGPARPFTGSGASRQARSWFYVGSCPVRSPTTANHGCKQQEERIDPEAVIVSTSALNPRRECRGPSRCPVVHKEAACRARPRAADRAHAVSSSSDATARWILTVVPMPGKV
jgi:hypothetical protein